MFAHQPASRGSSTNISRKLQLTDKPLPQELRSLSVRSDVFNLELPVDIQRVLFDFKKRLVDKDKGKEYQHSDIFEMPQDGDFHVLQAHSIDSLEKQFNELDQLLPLIEKIAHEDKTFFKKGEKDQLQLAIEQYKLRILETTLSYIKHRYALRKKEEEEKSAESSSLLKLLYGAVAVGGGLAAAADGVLAAITMFSGVASTIMIPVTIAIAWINLRLYRAVELGSLKEEFGLDDDEHIDQLMQTKQKQVDVTAKINSCILGADVAMMKEGSFSGYAKLAKAAHTSIKKQNEKTQEYQEPGVKRFARFMMGGSGAAIMGAFGYFSIQEAIFGLVAVGILGSTPPGWIILGLSVFAAACTAVGYLFAVQGLGLFHAFNPQANAVRNVKQSYDSYGFQYQDFDKNLTEKMELNDQLTSRHGQLEPLKVQTKIEPVPGKYRSAGLFSDRTVENLDERAVVQVGRSFAI